MAFFGFVAHLRLHWRPHIRHQAPALQGYLPFLGTGVSFIKGCFHHPDLPPNRSCGWLCLLIADLIPSQRTCPVPTHHDLFHQLMIRFSTTGDFFTRRAYRISRDALHASSLPAPDLDPSWAASSWHPPLLRLLSRHARHLLPDFVLYALPHSLGLYL